MACSASHSMKNIVAVAAMMRNRPNAMFSVPWLDSHETADHGVQIHECPPHALWNLMWKIAQGGDKDNLVHKRDVVLVGDVVNLRWVFLWCVCLPAVSKDATAMFARA